jgi:hypothetical protein
VDLGIFLRSRLCLAVWLAAPPLLAAGVHAWASSQRAASVRRAGGDRALIEVIPAMERSLKRAREAADRFGMSAGGGASSREQLDDTINATAARHHMTINHIGFDASGAAPGSRLAVKAEGALSDLVSFLDELQSREQALQVDRAGVSLAGDPAIDPPYSGEFAMSLKAVKP